MVQVPYNPAAVPAVSRGGGSPGVRSSGFGVEAFGGVEAKALEGLGKAVTHVGDEAAQEALRWQGIENTADVNNLAVEADTKIGQLKAEYFAKQGKDAVDSSQEFMDKVHQIRDETLAGATNPAVQRELDNSLRRTVGYTLVNWGQHVATQERHYAEQGAQSRLQLEQQNALGAGDAQFADVQRQSAAQVENLAKIHGWDDATKKVELEKAQGANWAARLNYLGLTQPKNAWDLYEKNKEAISAGYRPQLEKQLWDTMLTHGAAQVAAEVNAGKDLGGIKDLIAKHESGSAGYESTFQPRKGEGPATPPPRPVTEMTINEILAYQKEGKTRAGSPAYPVGKYQIVRSTLQGLVKEMGLTGDEKFTPALQEKMGDRLLARRGDDVEGLRAEWEGLKNVPESEIRAALGRTRTMSESEQLELAKHEAKTYAPADRFGEERAREFEEAVVRQTATRYSLDVKMARESQRADEQTLYTGMLDPKVKTLDDLLADPARAESYQRLPPKTQLAVQEKLRRDAAQDANAETPEREENYTRLVGMAVTDPRAFIDTDLFKEDLRRKDLDKLQAMRMRAIKGQGEDVNVTPFLQNLRESGFFEGTGITPNTSPTNTRYHQFAGAFHQLIMEDKINTGRMPDFERQKKLAAQLFLTKKGWFGGEYKALDEEGAAAISARGAVLEDFQRRWQRLKPGLPLPPVSEQLRIINQMQKAAR